MSRHLDRQTGPNITVGNQRSQFYRREKESRITEGCRSPFNSQSNFFSLIHTKAMSLTWAVPGPGGFVVLVKPNLAWSRSSSGSLPCHKRQRFITSPLLASCIFFPSTLFSYSALQRSVFISLLLPHSNTFSFNSFVIHTLYQYLFSLLFCCVTAHNGSQLKSALLHYIYLADTFVQKDLQTT